MSSFTKPLEYERYGTSLVSGRSLYKLTKEFSYVIGSLDNPISWEITVPAGFITDFASVPYPFYIWIRPDGPLAKAAVIHDYLYTYYSFDNGHQVPDAIFYEAMLNSNISKIMAWIIWKLISIFGKSSSY